MMKVKLLQSVHEGMRFASGTIKYDTLERQTMGVNKYASKFPMASCNIIRKHVITEEKNVA